MSRPEHTTVLRDESIRQLNVVPGGIWVDVTCGLGGHAEALLEASAPDGRVVAIDRDPHALDRARQRLAGFAGRVDFVHGPFSALDAHLEGLGIDQVDGLVADLGVSSLQLDAPERGFSFRAEGPLDMRMDPTAEEDAGGLVDRIDRAELTTILKSFGEVERPKAVARAILAARDCGRLVTTKDLTRAVESVLPARREASVHPATRVFQALRIAVNRELEEVDALLHSLPGRIRTGGRVAIISFHSLEDRRVKRAFSGPAPRAELRHLPVSPAEGPWEPLHRSVIRPSPEEIRSNPRARSAKLRAARRKESV